MNTRKLMALILLFPAITTTTKVLAQAHANDNLWYNNGAQVFIDTNCLITIQGDITNNKAGIAGITHLNNKGFIWVQGNMYGDDAFSQAGNGKIRLQNKTTLYTAPYASEAYQLITGGYQVHGNQSVIGTANDGSFYDVELDNSSGFVFLKDSTDVRNSINFKPASITVDGVTIIPNGRTNTIRTYDPGNGATPANAPTNGANYTSVFGMMNNTSGMSHFINTSSNLLSNTNTADSGYIQGMLRRAIEPVSGGTYGFPIGLESSTGNANARGIQYAALQFGANNYNVVTGYFQQGSDNTVASPGTVCNIQNSFLYYGTSHGQWNFKPSTISTEAYSITIYPQDYGTPNSPLYFITKDNAVPATATQSCASSPQGLSVSQLSGFSTFGFAGGSNTPLSVILESFEGRAIADCNIELQWKIADAKNFDQFEVTYSTDGKKFMNIGRVTYTGQTTYSFTYHQNLKVGYYRLNMIDKDGTSTSSNIVSVITTCTTNKNELIIWPNPFYTSLFIDNLPDGVKEITLTNAVGSLIKRYKTADNKTTIDMQAYAAGLYLIRIADKDGIITTRKLVKRS